MHRYMALSSMVHISRFEQGVAMTYLLFRIPLSLSWQLIVADSEGKVISLGIESKCLIQLFLSQFLNFVTRFSLKGNNCARTMPPKLFDILSETRDCCSCANA